MVLHPTINTEGVESDSLLNGSHHENHPPSPRYPRCPASQATLGQVPQPLSWLPHAGQALCQDQEISRSLENTDILIFKKSLEKMLMQRKRNEKNEEKKENARMFHLMQGVEGGMVCWRAHVSQVTNVPSAPSGVLKHGALLRGQHCNRVKCNITKLSKKSYIISQMPVMNWIKLTF